MNRPTWDDPAVMPILGELGVDAQPVYVNFERPPTCLYAVVFSTEQRMRAATEAFDLKWERFVHVGALAAAFAIVPETHDGLQVHLAFDVHRIGAKAQCVRITREQCPEIAWVRVMRIAGDG